MAKKNADRWKVPGVTVEVQRDIPKELQQTGWVHFA